MGKYKSEKKSGIKNFPYDSLSLSHTWLENNARQNGLLL